MFYIYHIKGKKIGCSTNPKHRVKYQGHSEYEILESHSDIIIASNREIELQKEYGYQTDDTPYYITIKAPNKESSKIWASKLGKSQGLKNVKSGLLEKMRAKANCSLGGINASTNPNHVNKKTIKCPHCGNEGQYISMYRWHMDNCKHKV